MSRKRWEWLDHARLEYDKLPDHAKGVVAYLVLALVSGRRVSHARRGRVEAYQVPLEQFCVLFYATSRDARRELGLHIRDAEPGAGKGFDSLAGGFVLAQARLTDSNR
jgi:hypothetical protein